jgi:hypothetical protein
MQRVQLAEQHGPLAAHQLGELADTAAGGDDELEVELVAVPDRRGRRGRRCRC